jgi:hypothetical protein
MRVNGRVNESANEWTHDFVSGRMNEPVSVTFSEW